MKYRLLVCDMTLSSPVRGCWESSSSTLAIHDADSSLSIVYSLVLLVVVLMAIRKTGKTQTSETDDIKFKSYINPVELYINPKQPILKAYIPL